VIPERASWRDSSPVPLVRGLARREEIETAAIESRDMCGATLKREGGRISSFRTGLKWAHHQELFPPPGIIPTTRNYSHDHHHRYDCIPSNYTKR
jgi:hypothetical protein